MNKLLLLFSSFMVSFGFAQEINPNGCTTHSLSKEVLENNPEQKALFDASEAGFAQYQAQKSASRAQQSPNKKIIPVVVHVFHGNDNNNISDEHIQSAIDQATTDFMLANADTVNVIDMFKPIIGKMNVEFRLAKIDPDGNCTNGITRHYHPYLTHNAGEPMKDVVKWDVKKYLNVWVGKSLTNGAGGYSFLPYTAPNGDQDAGIVIRHQQFGSIANLGLFDGRSFTHEIGHYLGLPHTWGPSNTPGLQVNCTTDDGIQDTPNTDGATNCNNMHYVGCSPDTANIQNIMCYSGCARMFTEGQVDKAQYYLDTYATGGSPRKNLWQESNLIATGTNDGYVEPQYCAPTPSFRADITEICAGESVQFSNESYGQAATSFSWEFEGAVTTTSTDENPLVQYNTPGDYKVKLTTTLNSSNKTIEKESYIKVLNPEAKHIGALIQSFEDNFVFNDFGNVSSWYKKSDSPISSLTWKITEDGASHGTKALRTRTKHAKLPIDITLITRAIDKSQMTNQLFLNFKYAYKAMQDSDDELSIFVSPDCGNTWLKRKKITTSSLPTTGGVQTTSYKPSASHWKSVNVNLSTATILAADKIYVKFVLTGYSGNYLYIDEVNVSTGLSTSEIEYNSANISIYPNPVNSGATTNVNFNLVESSTYTVKVIDVLGRTIQVSKGNGKEGENTLQLKENLNSGLYWIELSSSNTKMTKKFQVL